MRLSITLAATAAVLLQSSVVLGFSILRLPTTTTTTTTRQRTNLAFSATPKENPQKITPESSTAADDDDVKTVLSTLEKRLQGGPGSLSVDEVEDFKAGTERILVEMKKTEQAVAAPAAATAPDSSEDDAVDLLLSKVAAANGAANDDRIEDLRIAVSKVDATTVSSLLDAGVEMDEQTTEAAFWAVVKEVDRAEEADEPLSADVTRMLHHIFDADLQHLINNREQIRTNVTCMQPDDAHDGVKGFATKMSYVFDDMAHRDLPLKEGRRCEDGECCDKCSRNVFPTFATDSETNFDTFPGIYSLTFNELETVPASTIIQFVRLIERVRRTIAYEYGLPLKTILPLQAYSRKYVAGTTQQGGGGGEGDFVILHTDESTHAGYHYSCVLYLSNQGEDFEGGDFVFNDPDPDSDSNSEEAEEELMGMSLEEEIRRAGRKLTPFHPTRGAAVIFSSGWENMHEVEKITSGTRYAVPCFFTTCPVPEGHYEQMHVGKPKTDEDIADDWLHLLLAHRKESPVESVGRVKELMMKWHFMCAPLSMH